MSEWSDMRSEPTAAVPYKESPRPISIKVGPFQFEVRYEPEIKPNGDREVEGYCDNGRHIIAVSTDGKSEDFIRSSLLHELKHAVLRLTVDSSDRKFTEEKIIQRQCNLELALFRDNPELRRYLFGGE